MTDLSGPSRDHLKTLLKQYNEYPSDSRRSTLASTTSSARLSRSS